MISFLHEIYRLLSVCLLFLSIYALITLPEASKHRQFHAMYKTIFDKENKLWKGHDVQPLYNPQISIAQVLLNSMKVNGAKIAQVNI